MSTLKRSIIVFVLFALAACSGTPTATPTAVPTASPFTENHQKWEAQNVTHYRYKVDLLCFCAFRDKMPLTIEVDNGQTVSILDNQGQQITESLEVFERYDSIEAIFSTVDAALNGEADKIEVEYNSEYGFPQSANIDYIEEAIDDELTFTVSDFEVLQ